MYRDIAYLTAKLFATSNSFKYSIVYAILISIHELLYLSIDLVILYIVLTGLFIASAVYADKKLLNQVKESFLISGARQRILRLFFYMYVLLGLAVVMVPQVLVFYIKVIPSILIILIALLMILFCVSMGEIVVRLSK